MDRAKYMFRRQFVLGPRYVDKLPFWRRIKINQSLYLTSHPELEVSRVNKDGVSIVLLGYILDLNNPSFTNEDILRDLIEKQGSSINGILNCVGSYGGRWIIILDTGTKVVLFNDATGLRQVFYTNDHSGPWCASQPGIIAEELGLKVDVEAAQFIKSLASSNREYWWPGQASLYHSIKRLLPNHYLDIDTMTMHRYWPKESLKRIDLTKAIDRLAGLFKGLIISAHNRFKLSLPLTAGWDSRLLLASVKDIAQEVFYYTLIYYDLDEESDDIRIPQRLLSRLGLKHHLIKCPPTMTEDFKSIYLGNVSCAHEAWGAIAQGLCQAYPEDRVCLKGNVSEIARNYYGVIRNQDINSRLLAYLSGMEHSFAVNQFSAWLNEAKGVCERAGIRITDLFYWEQRMGSWQAMSQLEWDIAQEVFTPYNCRDILVTMLSVDTKYRRTPNYILYRRLMESLWPEVLLEPINPQENKVKLLIKDRIKPFLYPLFIRIKGFRAQ